jgi:sulfate transporter 4
LAWPAHTRPLRRRLGFLRFCGPILVTVLSLIIENAGKFYVIDYNDSRTPVFKDVGPIPAGLPPITVTWWLPLYNTSQQLVLATIICILDIAESTTVARAMAQRHRYRLDFTQELRALGITNLVGAVFGCYTTTGAFSRTSVNSMAGGKTLMTSLVTGVTIMVILLWCTPVFRHLSVNVQGAIVIVSVLPLFQFDQGWFYWKVNKLDFITWLAAYLVTSFAGALPGIATGVALSLVAFLLRAGFPRITTPALLPGADGLYNDADVYADATREETEGVVLLRVEAPLFFGNINLVKEHIEELLARRRASGEAIAAVVLDMTPVTGGCRR